MSGDTFTCVSPMTRPALTLFDAWNIGLSVHNADNETLSSSTPRIWGRCSRCGLERHLRCRINRLRWRQANNLGGRACGGSEHEADWPKDGVGYLHVGGR